MSKNYTITGAFILLKTKRKSGQSA